MFNKKGAKRALLMSVLSLILCCSMLVGTTFAWFTDEVKSGTNIIAAGNLDVELLHTNGNVADQKVEGATNLFVDENGEAILWEPGVVAYETLTVKNVGNLALKYNLAINFTNENFVVDAEGNLTVFGLSSALKVAVVENTPADRAAAIEAGTNAGWNSLKSFNLPGSLEAGKEETYTVVIYWQPSDLDNNWNVNNGKTVSDGYTVGDEPALHIDLGVHLTATQKMHESDSFGPDYDSLANAWDGSIGEVPAEDNGVITLTTGAELAAFAASVNDGTTYKGKTVVLGADINLGNNPWTPIGDCKSGNYFQGTFDGQGHTIYNLSVDKSSDTYSNSSAGLFGWVNDKMATVKNVKLENATVMGSHWVGGIAGYFTGRIENCSVNNSTIMGFNVNEDANGDKVGGIVGYLNEHSYINNNTVTGTDITGNREAGGIAGAVAASTYEMKNNTVKDTTICYSEERDYASAGEIVSGRNGYVANDSNVATNVTIVKSAIVSTADELKNAVEQGITNLYLADGVYENITGCAGKTLTISGSKNAVLKLYNIGENGCDYTFGAAGTGIGNITFNGVTIDTTANTGNYKGYAYMKGTFNDCNFVGAYSLNNANDFEFNRCTFDFKDGYFWTWAAKSATFNDCTFGGNSKAILAHGTASTVITFNDCKFAATEKGYASNGTVWTAAVEIDPVGTNIYTITFNGENTLSENYSGWTRIKDESTGHIITGLE